MKPIVPTEQYEQTCLVNWLSAHDYKYCAFAQSTFTRSWAQKTKNTRMGVVPGWPDMAVILKNDKLIWIELKRAKPGRSQVSAEQRVWQEVLNRAGTPAFICYGFTQAVQKILEQELV